MEENHRGKNPKLILNEKELDYRKQMEKEEKELRDKKWAEGKEELEWEDEEVEDEKQEQPKLMEKSKQEKSISIKELEKKLPAELCQSCQKFYSCENTKNAERLGKIIRDCNGYKDIAELPYRSLQDVYYIFLKWFPNFDTTRIDTRLAWYISNEYGLRDALWMIEIARSGLSKSTLTESMDESPKIIPVGQLSAKALISGLTQKVGGKDVPVSDLGMRLQNRNRCLIVSETAHLKSLHNGTKKEVFGTLKQLHDGGLKRDTGTGVSKEYKNCNTSIWFNSTPDFQNETIIHQEIGTCYLVDAIPLDIEDDEEVTKKAIEDRYKSSQIREETTYVVKCFLAHHHLKKIEFNDEDSKFLTREANRLKWIRATCSYDTKNELVYIPQPELPARVAKQLSKLYESLISLDENYSKERAKKIIQRVVDGSGDPVLVEILEFIDDLCWSQKKIGKDISFTVYDVVIIRGLGTQTIKRRLELLIGLGFLRKEFEKSGPEGGPPGYHYNLRDDVKEEDWQALFRHSILKKSDITGK